MSTLLNLGKSARIKSKPAGNAVLEPTFNKDEVRIIRLLYGFWNGNKTSFANHLKKEILPKINKDCCVKTIQNILNNVNYGKPKQINRRKRKQLSVEDKILFSVSLGRGMTYQNIIRRHHKRLNMGQSTLRNLLRELDQENKNESKDTN